MSWDDANAELKKTTEIEDRQLGEQSEDVGMTKDEIAARRFDREQHKANCLGLAHNPNDTADQVVNRAKAYYSFVTGKKIRS